MNSLAKFFLIICTSISMAMTQTIISVAPNNAQQDQSLDVSITGQNTHFAQGSGTTNVWFSQGSSTINANNFYVHNDTLLDASFNIPEYAPTGTWDVSVQDEVDGIVTLVNGFALNPSSNPIITYVNPNSAYQGENLGVQIYGQNTHFAQGSGTTNVWFSQGSSTINAYNFLVYTNTYLRAYFNIPANAPTSYWNVSINNYTDGAITLENGFTIVDISDMPIIVSVDPDNAIQGQSLDVSITGQNTHFAQGSGTWNVWFSQGSLTISASNFSTPSNTLLSANFNIPDHAPTGLWDVSVHVVNYEIITLDDGFTIAFTFTDYPLITTIVDVPEDQGGRVFVNWNRSYYDNANFNNSIATYGIWERIPDFSNLKSHTINIDEALENPEICFVQDSIAWTNVGTVPAMQWDNYSATVLTFGDSTDIGEFWSVFFVSAHTRYPHIYYNSPIDSGYSIDNIAPAVPTGLTANSNASSIQLFWNEPVDEDFGYFNVYRGLEDNFDPVVTEPIENTIDNEFVDDDAENTIIYYYKISAVGCHGNESDYSESVAANLVSVEDELDIPEEFALNQNYPNPFNAVTTIRYNLPTEANVILKIIDMLGKEIVTLVEEYQNAGYYQICWNASDHPSGIYFYQIQFSNTHTGILQTGGTGAGAFQDIRKMILLK